MANDPAPLDPIDDVFADGARVLVLGDTCCEGLSWSALDAVERAEWLPRGRHYCSGCATKVAQIPPRRSSHAMPDVTYYVALPFVPNEEGKLVPGEAQDKQSAQSAIRAAEDMARKFGGAVAFSRTGDPNTGEFADAVVLRTFGTVPSLDGLFGG